MKSLLISTGIAMSLLVGCGKANFSGNKSEKAGENQTSSEKEEVELQGAFGSASLMLANATKFKINVVGCATGRTVTLTEADADNSLWLYDSGCVGKLESFEVEGLTYTLPEGTDFNTYDVGGTATFVAKDASDQVISSLTVTVRKQIDSPILDKTKCQEVEYSFNSIDKGNSQTVDPNEVGVKGSVVGEKLPDMWLNTPSLMNINAAGAGIFDFKIVCLPSTFAACKALLAAAAGGSTKIEYLLIKDTTNGVLTYAQAQALSWDPNQKVSLIGMNSFEIKDVAGPGKLNDAANRKMILALRINGSFVYFPVNVDDIQDKGCQNGPVCPPPPPCPKHCPL